MKKLSTLLIAIIFIGILFNSCKKITKRTISNDWEVTQLNQTEITVTSSYDRKKITEIEGDKATHFTFTPSNGTGDTTITNSTINSYTYSILKDGTWERTYDITTVNSDSTSEHKLIVSSGTWNFLGKNKVEEFKKNERVSFSTLSVQTIETITTSPLTGGSSINTVTYNETYIADQFTKVFLITSAENKQLILELDEDYDYERTENEAITNFTDYSNSLSITLTKVE